VNDHREGDHRRQQDERRRGDVRPNVSTSAPRTTTSGQRAEEQNGGPADLLKELVRYQSLGQFGRAWDLLHPAHQRIAPRSFYDGCLRDTATPPGGELEVTVIEVYDDPIDIPAIPEKTSKAVTYRIRLKGTDQTQTETSHAVKVDGEWRWVLAPQDVPYYRRGECPP
jgi:hypothetical protein